MATESIADEDDTLSDIEDDESPALVQASTQHTFGALLQELQAEKQARNVAENELSNLHASFLRLKAFTFEAVQQRDDAMRLKEEAESSKEDLYSKLNEAFLCRDDALKQKDDAIGSRDDAIRLRDEIALQKDVAIHARNSSRMDVEAATRLLVAGADSITTRASSIKSFSGNLPRSSSHSGVAAVAYGFTKRAESIVDELVRHLDRTSKDISNMRQQMEQQHYQSAIEVSELEASAQILKNDLLKKTLELERWQVFATEKERKLSEMEQIISDKQIAAEKETHALANALQTKESKLIKVEASIKKLIQIISETYETLASHAAYFFSTEIHLFSVMPISPTGEELEEGIQNCIDTLKEVMELFLKLATTWREQIDLRKKALEDLEGTITRLIVEKKEITNFLESALAIKQEMLEAVSKLSIDSEHNLNTVTKNQEAKIDGAMLPKSQLSSLSNKILAGEATSSVSTLEIELKKSRQEVFELQQFLAAARGEVELLRVTSERQTRELLDKRAIIEDFESKQCFARETIKDLKTELAAAGEDGLRWKQTATKEAEAGAFLLEEVEGLHEQRCLNHDPVKCSHGDLLCRG